MTRTRILILDGSARRVRTTARGRDARSESAGWAGAHPAAFGVRLPERVDSACRLHVANEGNSRCAGATGSYGTVTEPCNHLEKFPSRMMFIDRYFRGDTPPVDAAGRSRGTTWGR
jgi:hypothetical protein